MISAAQIREACVVLGWTPPTLAERAMLCFDEASLALDDAGILQLGGLQLRAIREALETAGAPVLVENGEVPELRSRKVTP